MQQPPELPDLLQRLITKWDYRIRDSIPFDLDELSNVGCVIFDFVEAARTTQCIGAMIGEDRHERLARIYKWWAYRAGSILRRFSGVKDLTELQNRYWKALEYQVDWERMEKEEDKKVSDEAYARSVEGLP